MQEQEARMNLQGGSAWVQPRPGLEPGTTPAVSQCSNYPNPNRMPHHGKQNFEVLSWQFVFKKKTRKLFSINLDINLSAGVDAYMLFNWLLE
jgi:hypothetical protein